MLEMKEQAIQNRYEFIMLFDVENGNPNGDPDADNMPRTDPETSIGLVTDVCLKRKIRNYVELAKEGEAGYNILIKADRELNAKFTDAYSACGLETTKKGKNSDDVKKAQEYICENYYDVRTFGAVMSTGNDPCGIVRGPVQINFTDYTVCGVVENVNRFCEFAWSEVYAPYSSNAIANKVEAGETQGNHIITILAHSSDDFEKIRNEVARGVAQINTTLGERELQLMGQPDNFRTQLNRKFANSYENLNAAYWKYGIMIIVILLVPAINLSGLTHTRMRRRLEELGIRKSFGATQGELVWQVLNENFVLTLIGGMLGLGLSYLCLWLMSDWLLQTAWGATATMNVSMVSPVVFFVALCFCLVLNLLSAYIPAWRVAHTPIVDSLNQKL